MEKRVLFDVLEKALKRTTQSEMIPKLYKGVLTNKIICEDIDFVSERQEDFYDITVLVKNMPNLEASLVEYFKPELLTGENKYVIILS